MWGRDLVEPACLPGHPTDRLMDAPAPPCEIDSVDWLGSQSDGCTFPVDQPRIHPRPQITETARFGRGMGWSGAALARRLAAPGRRRDVPPPGGYLCACRTCWSVASSNAQSIHWFGHHRTPQVQLYVNLVERRAMRTSGEEKGKATDHLAQPINSPNPN